MAQLSSDLFACGGEMLPVDEALALVGRNVRPVREVENVGLLDSESRFLAQDIIATVNLPPFFNSAVDGYAVCFADLAPTGETNLPIGARVAAGEQGRPDAVARRAVRIFTGAPIPPGLDTVFMQEDVRLSGNNVVLPQGLKPGSNCRPAGEDIREGALALAAGRVMTPESIALAAALGVTDVCVRRRVRVAVFSTGNEVVSPGAVLGAAQIYDANRFLLQALLRRLGADVTDFGILKDDRAATAHALREAANKNDVIITSGGVSTGEEDLVKAAVEEVGSLTFWRLAIKPGRPVAMGVIPSSVAGEGAAFVGLPGNPVAVFVTFAHLVRPLLTALGGGQPAAPVALPVKVAFPYRKKANRREYVRVALRAAADGAMEAVKHPQDGAGVLTSLTQTHGLIELREGIESISPGDTVGFLSYALLR
jgi:molybdopterin molybdotransferase